MVSRSVRLAAVLRVAGVVPEWRVAEGDEELVRVRAQVAAGLEDVLQLLGRVRPHGVEEEPAEGRAGSRGERGVEHLVGLGVHRRGDERRGGRVHRADVRTAAEVDDAGGGVGLGRPLRDRVGQDPLRVTLHRRAVVLLTDEHGREAGAAGAHARRARPDGLQEERVRRRRDRREVQVDRTRLAADLAPVGQRALEDVLQLRGGQRRDRRVRVADHGIAHRVPALRVEGQALLGRRRALGATGAHEVDAVLVRVDRALLAREQRRDAGVGAVRTRDRRAGAAVLGVDVLPHSGGAGDRVDRVVRRQDAGGASRRRRVVDRRDLVGQLRERVGAHPREDLVRVLAGRRLARRARRVRGRGLEPDGREGQDSAGGRQEGEEASVVAHQGASFVVVGSGD